MTRSQARAEGQRKNIARSSSATPTGENTKELTLISRKGLAGVSPKSPSGSSKASSVGKAQSSNIHTAAASNLSFSTILKKVRGSKVNGSSRKKETPGRDIHTRDKHKYSGTKVNLGSYIGDSMEEKTAVWQDTELDQPFKSFLGRVETEPKSRGSDQRRFEDTFGVRARESKKESTELIDASKSGFSSSKFKGFREEKKTLLQLKNIIDGRIKAINTELYTGNFKKQNKPSSIRHMDQTSDDTYQRNSANEALKYSLPVAQDFDFDCTHRKSSHGSANHSNRLSFTQDDGLPHARQSHTDKSVDRSRRSAKQIIDSIKMAKRCQPAAYLEPHIDSVKKQSVAAKVIPLNIRHRENRSCSLAERRKLNDRQVDDFIDGVRQRCDAWHSKRQSAAFDEAASHMLHRSKSVSISEALRDRPYVPATDTPKFTRAMNSSIDGSIPQLRYAHIEIPASSMHEDLSSGRGQASTSSEQKIKAFIKSYY